MPKVAVPFAAEAGKPLTLHVTATTGRKYHLQVGVVVFSVVEKVGETNPDGLQAFEIRASIAMDTSEDGAS